MPPSCAPGKLAPAIEDATERFTVYYGLWLGNAVRGELGFAREIAETFLREAQREARATECAAGRRLLGSTCLWQGDFIEAQANLVEVLSYDPERDREARFRFLADTGATARAILAITKWQLGEVGPARALIEEAVAHAIEIGHVPTLVAIYFYKAQFEMVRGDAGAARRDAEILVKLSQENAMTQFTAWGALRSAWASARLDDRETGAMQLRQALAAYTNQGNKLDVPFFQGFLAGPPVRHIRLFRATAQHGPQHVGKLLGIVRHCSGEFETHQELEHALLFGKPDEESVQPEGGQKAGELGRA